MAFSQPYLNQRSNILILDASLSADFVESASVRTISHRLILQIAFATLVADGAIEGVIGEKKFHDALAGFVYER